MFVRDVEGPGAAADTGLMPSESALAGWRHAARGVTWNPYRRQRGWSSGVVRISGHAYPWDVVGDPAFTGRVLAHGIGSVTLAAAYHSTRAATPLHPQRQVFDVPYAALYRPVRASVWAGQRLRPLGPPAMGVDDPFAAAAEPLRAAGLRVNAWIVLTHNTRLGTEFPAISVTNCFGDRYPYALCPSHPEVRDYAATLATEALHDAPVDEVSLEACGQLGLQHLSHHDKTDDAWTPHVIRLLSICCCTACERVWQKRGLDPGQTRAMLRAAVRAGCQPGAAQVAPDLDAQVADALLATRHAAADALRAQVLEAVRRAAPHAPVTLHAQPDPWATGASPGLTPTAASDVDAVLVPVWPTTAASADHVSAVASTGATVDAYVTVLPPADPAAVTTHVRHLAAAGATRFSLYHLGLAPHWRQPSLSAIVDALRSASGGHDP
jgi:hypothetical protein